MAPLDGKLVLFGGANDTQVFTDTWMFDGTEWTELTVGRARVSSGLGESPPDSPA